MNSQNKLIVFQNKNIRRVWHKEEWFYSAVDVVAVLSESKSPTDYLKKIRKRDEALKIYIGTNCPHVEMANSLGKKRKLLAADANKKVAKRGGGVAGNARKETEKELGRNIVTAENNLDEIGQLKLEN